MLLNSECFDLQQAYFDTVELRSKIIDTVSVTTVGAETKSIGSDVSLDDDVSAWLSSAVKSKEKIHKTTGGRSRGGCR